MSEFLAYRIIAGKLNFTDVPTKLKEEVREILIKNNHVNLLDGE